MGFLYMASCDNEEDYMNARRLRNRENTENFNYNCGGFALGTFNWYFPYDKDEREDYLECLSWEGVNGFSIIEKLLEEDVAQMMEDFGSRLRPISCIDELLNDEVGIAYRIGFNDEGPDYASPENYDFHFRLFENGRWSEKCGAMPIRGCEMNEDSPWYCEDIIYFSPIRFFGLKKI